MCSTIVLTFKFYILCHGRTIFSFNFASIYFIKRQLTYNNVGGDFFDFQFLHNLYVKLCLIIQSTPPNRVTLFPEHFDPIKRSEFILFLWFCSWPNDPIKRTVEIVFFVQLISQPRGQNKFVMKYFLGDPIIWCKCCNILYIILKYD